MDPLHVSLECGKFDRGIRIHYSNWGRTAPIAEMCPLLLTLKEDTSCYHDVFDYVASCSGLKKCSVNITGTLPNPCYGTSRYIEVHYTCNGKWHFIWTDILNPHPTVWCVKMFCVTVSFFSFFSSWICLERSIICFNSIVCMINITL